MKPSPTFFLALIFVIASCNTSDINDKEKRNNHWDWWIDASTGKGIWIPLSDHPTWRNGKYTSFYYDGKIFETGTIKEGKYVDTSFPFNREGKIYGYKIHNNDSATGYFINDGIIQVFGSDGKLLMEGVVKNHKAGNRWTDYYKSGFKKRDMFYVNDTGVCINYYENQQMEDSLFVMGNYYVVLKHWFENGQLAHSVGWKNNQHDGDLLDYFENGQLKQKGIYVNGHVNGEVKYWYPSGKLNGVSNYNLGEQTGKQIIYFENGQIKFEASTVNGQFEGEQKMYNEQGKVIKDKFYKDGVEVSQ